MASERRDAAGGIERRVVESVRALVDHTAFQAWLGSERGVEDGDLLVLNNSFLYRDLVKTRKAPTYLAWRYAKAAHRPTRSSVFVATIDSFNTDFKRWSKKGGNLPQMTRLPEALSAQLGRAGSLLYVLLGELQEVPHAVPLRHSLFGELGFDPALSGAVEVRLGPPATIVTGTLQDPEAVWVGLPGAARGVGVLATSEELPQNLEGPFADAFERLQTEAHLLASLPRRGDKLEVDGTLLGRMLGAVKGHGDDYEKALQALQGDGEAATESLNDVLRIAYNFASEVDKLLGLVVSICDLKPLLLWSTIHEHFSLAQAFRELPWTRSKKKPSLTRYREIIAEARNRVFHSLIPFGHTIEVDLEGVNLRAHRLHLFPAFGRRTTVEPLDYEDRELVEVLTHFTHVPEVVVPLRFWERNLEVMRGVQRLLEATLNGLRMMWEAAEQESSTTGQPTAAWSASATDRKPYETALGGRGGTHRRE